MVGSAGVLYGHNTVVVRWLLLEGVLGGPPFVFVFTGYDEGTILKGEMHRPRQNLHPLNTMHRKPKAAGQRTVNRNALESPWKYATAQQAQDFTVFHTGQAPQRNVMGYISGWIKKWELRIPGGCGVAISSSLEDYLMLHFLKRVPTFSSQRKHL